MASIATENSAIEAESLALEDRASDSTARSGTGFEDWSIARKLAAINIGTAAFGVLLVAIGWFTLGAIESALIEQGIANAAISGIIGRSQLALVIAFAASAAWMILGNARVVQGLGRGLARLSDTLQDLAGGNLDTHVPYRNRHDELGDIARSVEVGRRAAVELERYRAEREGLAAKEQERREREAKTLVELGASFDEMISQVVSGVATSSGALQGTVTAMASSAEASSIQIASVNAAMEEASQGVTAAAAASDEFAMSIGEISRQASSSAELARKANDMAEEANTTISALSEAAADIGQVVELIQTIAQRTNLLALNASIEAARGGDSGRGFAVVASEVKELASQTSKATQDVAAQIAEMQSSTTASVGALQSIGGQIKQLESTAISIAAAVDQQAVAGQDLARSIDRAAHGADEATINLGRVNATVAETGESARKVVGSAGDLEQQVSTLKEQVGAWQDRVRSLNLAS